MYIFKNAWKNIVRAKGRSILIFLLVFLITVASCIALSIQNSAEIAKDATYDSLSITAQINVDRQKIMTGANMSDKTAMRELLSQTLPMEELETYAESKYVSDFYYSASIGLNLPEDMEKYETSMSSFMGGRDKRMSMGDLSVVGYNSHDAMTDFLSGDNSIYDGTVFDQDSSDNSCLISYEFATLNELNVGDDITLLNPVDEEQNYTFKIVGMFKNDTTDTYANTIYTTYSSLMNVIEQSNNNVKDIQTNMGVISTAFNDNTNGTYVFSDIDSYDGFCEEVETLGLNTDLYTVSSSDASSFEESLVPLENLSNYTMIFFMVIMVIGGGILILFNLFSIRERKYEIGVLTAIGMKKSKVAMQYLIEVFIITSFAIIIGTSVGSMASQPVGNALLEEQIASVEEAQDEMNQSFGGNFQGQGGKGFGAMKPSGMMKPSVNDVDYVDSLTVGTDMTVIMQLMGVAILLTVFASGVGIISILRYDPLKILSNRA